MRILSVFGCMLILTTVVLSFDGKDENRILQKTQRETHLMERIDPSDTIIVHPEYGSSLSNLKLSDIYAQDNCSLALEVPKDLEDVGFIQSADTSPPKGYYALANLMTRTVTTSKFDYFIQTNGETVSAILDALRLTIKNKTLPESTAWLLSFSVKCGEQYDSYNITVMYSKIIETESQAENKPVEIIAGKVFSKKLAALIVPETMYPNLKVKLADGAASISFAHFWVYRGQLIVDGDAPMMPEGTTETYSTVVYVEESLAGLRSKLIQVKISITPPPVVSWGTIFLISIIIFTICMLMCLVFLLVRQSSSNQIKIVKDAVNHRPQNEMLTNSVIEWKKKEEVENSQLDQTAINEVYLFREAEIKKEKKKRVFDVNNEMDNRPSPMDLNCLPRKLSKDEVLTPGYSLNNTMSNTLDFRRMNSANDLTVDMSPIRIKQGMQFQVNTPNSSIIMSDGKAKPSRMDNPALKLSAFTTERKQVQAVLEEPSSPLALRLKQVTSEEYLKSPIEPGSADSNSKYQLANIDQIEEETPEDEVKYDTEA